MGFSLDKALLTTWRLRMVTAFIDPEDIVVDIGCGATYQLLKTIESNISRGIGVDRDVVSKQEGKLRLIASEMQTTIPVDSAVADVITMLAVIEHVDHPFELLNECYRILKQGGVLCLTTPTPRCRPLLEFLAFKVGILDRQSILEHKKYYWGYEIYHLLRNIGFSEVSWKEFQLGMNTFIYAKK